MIIYDSESKNVWPLGALLLLMLGAIGFITYYFGFFMYSFARGWPKAGVPERIGSALLFSGPFIVIAYFCIRKIIKIKNDK